METNATAPETLVDAVRRFADSDACLTFLAELRWPDGVTCPTCGSKAVYFDSSRNGWECKTRHEKRKFTLKTGTIFEDSPLGLDKWLPAVWMIANMKNGVSSHELAKSIGVTQKTAWFMLQRIRLAMQGDDGGTLGGEVEVDETYIGGKARNMHASKRQRLFGGSHRHAYMGKVAVLGLLDRHGKDGTSQIRTAIVAGRKKGHLQPIVRENVEAGATLHTDAHFSYQGLSSDYAHNVIDHAEAYVDGQVHTNGLENFWSLLKRALKGTYVNVEPFHLFRYLDEQAFRFNQRKATDSERFLNAVPSIMGRRLTYKHLTGNATCS